MTTDGPVQIILFDILGRRVKKKDAGILAVGTHTLDFQYGSLASGIYFLEVDTKNKVHYKKLIVLR
jgi:hypothetical protein